MNKVLIALLFVLGSIAVYPQAVRIDVPLQTSGPNVPSSGGPLPQALWVANATVAICTHPAASYAACVASPITTYTDSTLGTACPTTMQIVQLPGNTCAKFAGAAGNLGFWYSGGTVDYYVVSTYGTFGPYTITQNVGGGGGGVTPSPQFSLFYQPNPGSQAVAQGDPFATTDGAGDAQMVTLKTNAAVNGVAQSTDYAYNSTILTETGTPDAAQHDIFQNSFNSTLYSSTPGFNRGFPVGFTGRGWQVSKAASLYQYTNGSGIAQTLNADLNKYGVGDAITMYCYLFGSGGWTATSDENEKCFSANTNEDPNIYTGTCATGCTTGSTQLTTTPVHASTHQGTQRYVIDITQTPTQTTVTNIAPSGLDSTHMSAVTVAGTMPVSTAWGTIPAIDTPNVTVPPFTTSETFNVTIASGTFTTGLACFSSMFHDQALITAVGSVVAGVQSVTAAVHAQHASGSYLFQGGVCATGMEFPSYTKTISGVTYRYLFDVVGSTDAHTLQALEWFTGQAQPLTKYGQNFNVGGALYGCFNASLSSSGTTVTGTFLSFCASNYGIPSQYNLTPLYLSGNSDTALNGNCTGTVWSSASSFTCTNASLTGTHTSAGSVAQLSQAGSLLGLNNVNLWPMAAALDVQNETTTPPAVDGTFTIEPNNIAWGSGDTLEQPHHLSMNMNGEVVNKNTIDPQDQGTGLAVSMLNNPQGGNGSLASSAMFTGFMGGADANYFGLGGFEIPPNAMNLAGYYYILFNIDHAPAPNQSVINVKPRSAQLNNANLCYYLWNVNHLSGTYSLQDCPNSGNNAEQTGGNYSLTAGGTATYTATGHTFVGGITSNGTNVFGGSNTIASANLSTTGGIVSGQGYNFAPYSSTLTGATWQNVALGTGTTACAITDDLGNPACTITVTTQPYDWQDSLSTSSYTGFTLNAPYAIGARMRGHVGGEQVGFGADFLGSTVTLTSSWANYCVPFTASNGSGLKNFADFNGTQSGTAFDISLTTVVPGTSCSAIPLPTTNNQYTTLTSVNLASSLNSPYFSTAAEYSNGTCTTAATIAPANGNRQKITLTNGDTCALTFTQPLAGTTANVTLKVIQSSVSTFNGGISGCKWPGGAVPTITQTSGAIDFVGIYLDGTNAYCTATQNFQ